MIRQASFNNPPWVVGIQRDLFNTHEVFNEAGKLSAIIKVYGAWIDLEKRKLTIPPQEAQQLFVSAEKTLDFEEIQLKN